VWGIQGSTSNRRGPFHCREALGVENAQARPGAAIVRDAGFACACTVVAQPVWKESGRYELPRYAVEDWSGEELARRLAGWLGR